MKRERLAVEADTGLTQQQFEIGCRIRRVENNRNDTAQLVVVHHEGFSAEQHARNPQRTPPQHIEKVIDFEADGRFENHCVQDEK